MMVRYRVWLEMTALREIGIHEADTVEEAEEMANEESCGFNVEKWENELLTDKRLFQQ